MNKELLSQIEQLRLHAARVTKEIDTAKQRIAKYVAQIELLAEQRSALGIGSWDEADEKLAELENELEQKILDISGALAEIGITI